MSIMHLNLNLLSKSLNNCILVRSTPQILFIKIEYNFLFLDLIIGLFNSSANSLLDIFSFLIADLLHVGYVSDHAGIAASPEVFLSKHL